MAPATIGVQGCGLCTDLGSGTRPCLAKGGCQKKVLPLSFLVTAYVIKEEDK